ncbi:helix-turn-helix transcriptional regulator [Lysinibacillus pakistanensis]|uniref:helix-turn-helix domain-containing protein n=1 Tax=Lysinibacillus pakistanensis TaxID=759811 RepID=UPI003D2B5E1E
MTTFDRVKNLCEEQKISVVELEEKLGFSRNSLYSWKKNNPSSEKLEKVADFFKVSTDYLLGRTNEKRHYDTSIEYVEEDTDIRTLNRMAKDMTPNQRKKAIRVLEATFEDLFDDED